MFSIIMPTYNRAPVLEQVLHAVFAMHGVEECDVILVDDGSTDSTPKVWERFSALHPRMVIHRQENAGPGAARNAGLALATQNRILFLDDDVFPTPNLLKAHTRFLDGGFDLSQGILDWTPELANSWITRFMDKHGMQFAFNKVQDETDLSYLYVYTANLAIERKCILQHGGFDHSFAEKRYAFEDTAFAYTLSKGGCRLGLNKAATALHHHPMTPEGLASREYKVGYALGVLNDYYPEIIRDLNLNPTGVRESAIVNGLGMFLKSPLSRLLNKQLRLRLACREAMGRGRRDYERQNR